ncbi:HlyD family efflux transporter periplasmic adaptor subunit [Sorangium sp. So ce1036]|uniref:HlyD family secretion protein n=1 Tax=Sorangium sp. So ce1036 TaxID=3133328 RepID=UPI003F077042
MSAGFSRSIHAIATDGHRGSIAGVAIGALLLAGWLAWFFLARVGRYESSVSARLEVGQAAHRVEAPLGGRVAAVHLDLGAEVAAGDVLIELDVEPIRRDIDERRARLEAIARQMGPLRDEIAARARALRDGAEAARAHVDEAKARLREAEAGARFQELEAERAVRLRKDGLVSEAEAARLAAEAQSRRSASEALERAAARIGVERRTSQSEQQAELARLDREAASLEGERLVLEAAIQGLLAEIERRRIRSPIAGRVGDIALLRVGSFVSEGDVVAAVVPPGELRAIAEFPPSSIGRIRPGQEGRVRLDAFPWTEYGTLAATVERVATEAKEGRIRVELGVRPDPASPIPMQHGLPGSVVIEVERVSPATLVLRAAGQIVQAGGGAGGG